MAICGHCYGKLSDDETLIAYDGMAVHIECEIVAIGFRVKRDDTEWARYLGCDGCVNFTKERQS